MLAILESLTAAAHLAAVSFASAAPLVCVWLRWRWFRRGRGFDNRAAFVLARWSLIALLLGILLGGAALGLLWLMNERAYFQAFAAIPARRLWFGAAELVFSLLCLFAFVVGWERIRPRLHAALALLAVTNLIYHFFPLFSAVAVLSARGAPSDGPLPYGEMLSLFAAGETLSRAGHVLLAGFLLTGAAMMCLGLQWKRHQSQTTQAAALVAAGGRLALAAAVLQIPLGLVLLTTSSTADEFLSFGDPWTTTLFAASLLALLALFHHLLAVALGDTQRAVVVRSVTLAALIIVLMVAASHRARNRSGNLAIEMSALRHAISTLRPDD